MCLTLPGLVLSVQGAKALVETAGNARWCNALLHPELVVGDRVIVHAGLVLEVLSAEEVREMEMTLAELGMLELEITGGSNMDPLELD